MAITSGQQVKMVQVSTQAKYNDLVGKDPATIYWVAETKKAYLDGIGYGFNNEDVTADLLNSKTNFNDNLAGVTWNVAVINGKLKITGNIQRSSESDQMLVLGSDGRLYVSQETVNTLADTRINTLVTSKLGANSGIATLDTSGKVPTSQLPAYVDDVVEYSNISGFPASGDTGKIYVAKDTNKVYRWSGSSYIEISSSLALGETSSTAYRGDRGKTAYDHTSMTNNPHNVTKGYVGLGNVDNYMTSSQSEAQAGTASNKFMTPLRTSQAIEALAPKMTWTVVS